MLNCCVEMPLPEVHVRHLPTDEEGEDDDEDESWCLRSKRRREAGCWPEGATMYAWRWRGRMHRETPTEEKDEEEDDDFDKKFPWMRVEPRRRLKWIHRKRVEKSTVTRCICWMGSPDDDDDDDVRLLRIEEEQQSEEGGEDDADPTRNSHKDRYLRSRIKLARLVSDRVGIPVCLLLSQI